jgi:hypothetical protein
MGVTVGKTAFPLWSRFHAPIKPYDRDRINTLACSLKGYYLSRVCKPCIEKGKVLRSRTQETMACMPSAETRLLTRRSENLLLDSPLSLFRKERTKQMTIEYNFFMKYQYGYMFRSREFVIRLTLEQFKRK